MICKWLRYQYPNVIFRSDFAAGMKMTIGQAMRNKTMQSEHGYPDLFIAECRNGMGGLFIEIKNGYDKIYKKNGTLKKSEHIESQAIMLGRLREKGYWATFATSFDEAREIIDLYLK